MNIIHQKSGWKMLHLHLSHRVHGYLFFLWGYLLIHFLSYVIVALVAIAIRNGEKNMFIVMNKKPEA